MKNDIKHLISHLKSEQAEFSIKIYFKYKSFRPQENLTAKFVF